MESFLFASKYKDDKIFELLNYLHFEYSHDQSLIEYNKFGSLIPENKRNL